jgi:hypothetical protein
VVACLRASRENSSQKIAARLGISPTNNVQNAIIGLGASELNYGQISGGGFLLLRRRSPRFAASSPSERRFEAAITAMTTPTIAATIIRPTTIKMIAILDMKFGSYVWRAVVAMSYQTHLDFVARVTASIDVAIVATATPGYKSQWRPP